MPRKLLATVLVVVPLVLAACGDDDEDTTTSAASDTTTATTEATTPSGGGETVAISETEYEIAPPDPTVKAGSVTFEVTNDGSTIHDLEIEGDGVEEKTATIQPGDSDSLTVDLQPGSYKLYCTIDGHEDLGMTGELTVE